MLSEIVITGQAVEKAIIRECAIYEDWQPMFVKIEYIYCRFPKIGKRLRAKAMPILGASSKYTV